MGGGTGAIVGVEVTGDADVGIFEGCGVTGLLVGATDIGLAVVGGAVTGALLVGTGLVGMLLVGDAPTGAVVIGEALVGEAVGGTEAGEVATGAAVGGAVGALVVDVVCPVSGVATTGDSVPAITGALPFPWLALTPAELGPLALEGLGLPDELFREFT